MNKIMTIFLIAGYASVLFGSVYMIGYADGGGIPCLATRLNGSQAPCPKADPFGFAKFHADALMKFSVNTVFADYFSALYSLVFVLVLSLPYAMKEPCLSGKNRSVHLKDGLRGSEPKAVVRNLFWFSLSEKRDAVSFIVR